MSKPKRKYATPVHRLPNRMKPRRQQQSCQITRQVAWLTELDAKLAMAVVMRYRKMHPATPYRCGHCKGWHVRQGASA